MKKINQVLLIGGFSILAIGLSAKNLPGRLHSKLHQVKAVSPKKFIEKGITQKKATAVTTATVQYPETDMPLQASYSLTNGWNIEYINRMWTIQDTGSGTTENFDLSHYATVAFDTILDVYTTTAYSAAAGSLTIDTLIAPVLYKNTSGTNDTVEFIITNVLPNGYPGTTVLYTDTVVLNKGMNLPGRNLDTIYQLGVLPNFNIASGTKFAVTLQFSGSKADTFAFCYAFPTATCASSGSAYANTFTYIGYPLGPNPACNSYVTGWEYYEYPNFAPTTWPDSHGNQQGSLSVVSGAGAFDNDEWNLCGVDTEYFYWQDIAIYASVSFTDVTGINTIYDNGFSISQNSPNPFNKTSQINYNLTKPSDIIFTVNDITGRELVNNKYTLVSPGKHQITLDAKKFKAGVYFYSFNINGRTETRKMVIE
jgi:hypothetical protein